MKTIRVRLANAVMLCGATGLAIAITLTGSAQSDEQGGWKKASKSSNVPKIEDRLDTHQNAEVTRKLQSLFNEQETSDVRHASAVAEDDHSVEQVAGESQPRLAPEPNTNIERKSDVLQHLEELYQKEGREMPPMSLDQAPNTSGPAPEPPRKQAAQQVHQPVQQSAQPQQGATTEEPQAETKKPGLLHRIFGKRSTKPAAKTNTQATAKSAKSQPHNAKSPTRNPRQRPQTAAPTQDAAPQAAAPVAAPTQTAAPAQVAAPQVVAPTQAAAPVETAFPTNVATPQPVAPAPVALPTQAAVPTPAAAPTQAPVAPQVAQQPQFAQQPQQPQRKVLPLLQLKPVNPAHQPSQVQQTTTVEDAGTVHLASPTGTAVQDEMPKAAPASPAERAGVEDPLLVDESVFSGPANSQREIPAPTPAPAQIPVSETATSLPDETTESTDTEEVGKAHTNPFTGLKLDDAAAPTPQPVAQPAELKRVDSSARDIPPWAQTASEMPAAPPQDAPARPAALPLATEPAAEPAAVAVPAPVAPEAGVEHKLSQIVERTGKPGLKGFCVVALRDDRELVDSQPEFQAAFEGKSYYFSTAKSRVKFLQNPRKYVPVAGGADVVVLAHTHQTVAGTLDHSLWFRERLFLFNSAESRESFMHHPQQYIEAALSPVAK